eukprot:COSAG05_NODE_8320_length_714_cov_2.434146_1_plen_200_part_01
MGLGPAPGTDRVRHLGRAPGPGWRGSSGASLARAAPRLATQGCLASCAATQIGGKGGPRPSGTRPAGAGSGADRRGNLWRRRRFVTATRRGSAVPQRRRPKAAPINAVDIYETMRGQRRSTGSLHGHGLYGRRLQLSATLFARVDDDVKAERLAAGVTQRQSQRQLQRRGFPPNFAQISVAGHFEHLRSVVAPHYGEPAG